MTKTKGSKRTATVAERSARGSEKKGTRPPNRLKKKSSRKAELSPLSKITEGSGNVFRDLGLSNPEQELMKTRLTLEIYRIIRQRGLTQTQAAEVLGVKQPHVSLLMRNRSGSFSAGRLMEFLTALGRDVEITVRVAAREHGEMSVRLK